MVKKAISILFALALVLGCGGGKDPVTPDPVPATIQGTWVFSRVKVSDEWIPQNIKEVMVFDGAGHYYVKAYTGTAQVTFNNGRLEGATDADFLRKDDRTFDCTVTGEEYSFESVPAKYTLVASSTDYYEFTFRKMEKVQGFDPGEGPDPGDESYINGSYVNPSNNVNGCIKDASTGKGIPGVVVSDGYSTVVTDVNGVYQFDASTAVNATTRYVCYSLPSGYKLQTENGIPNFFKRILAVPATGSIRTDWTLEPLDKPETRWTLVCIGDPQCGTKSEVNRYINETVADMKSYLPKFENPYAVTLGDIVHDSNATWEGMKDSMSGVNVQGRTLPFFQVMGNHDHNALVDNAYKSSQLFIDTFGPENYSFNRGDAHVVCFDNVLVKERQTNSSKANGWTWHSYDSGMSDTQIEWFKKDMSFVENKADKLLIICCHIPFADAAPKHRTEIMNYFKQFKEVHIMAGHTHYNRNYIHTAFVTKSGLPTYEHIHGTACGAWWEAKSSCNTTGAPSGYTVYEIEGSSIVNWVMKGTGKAEGHQFRVYDGNQTYTGTKGYYYNWFRTDNTGGSANIVSKGYSSFKNAFVVEVFDDDSRYVTVELYRGGVKAGDFKHVERGVSANICAASWFFNERGKNTSTWSSTASPYWYYTTTDPVPASMEGWEVRMTRTIPGSGRKNVYTCSTLTTDYEDFKKK